jgi:hypothetical protein
MDSLAVSQQSGSTNYESNSTPVPEILNRSQNYATGKSKDSNARQSQKLRQSDTATADGSKINEMNSRRTRGEALNPVHSMSRKKSKR